MSAPAADRPLVVGDEAGPTPPFPLRMEGPVIRGFGRGSKQLGIPTANLPVEKTAWLQDAASGVYFGWVTVSLEAAHPDAATLGGQALPMVMSVGTNPFFNNERPSAEVHVLAPFAADFYRCPMRVLVLAFVRPQRGDYDGQDALIADIHCDCDVARRSLARPAWRPRPDDVQWLMQCPATLDDGGQTAQQ